jgi:hypothetical protein
MGACKWDAGSKEYKELLAGQRLVLGKINEACLKD